MMKATMTNQQTPTGTTRDTKRNMHPAISARIISSGLAIASTLGIASAFTVSAKAETTGNQVLNNLILAPTQNVLATVPATAGIAAPTRPAPAAATPAAVTPAAAPPAATAQAPVVINIAPPAPQAQWTPPATTGSK